MVIIAVSYFTVFMLLRFLTYNIVTILYIILVIRQGDRTNLTLNQLFY